MVRPQHMRHDTGNGVTVMTNFRKKRNLLFELEKSKRKKLKVFKNYNSR